MRNKIIKKCLCGLLVTGLVLQPLGIQAESVEIPDIIMDEEVISDDLYDDIDIFQEQNVYEIESENKESESENQEPESESNDIYENILTDDIIIENSEIVDEITEEVVIENNIEYNSIFGIVGVEINNSMTTYPPKGFYGAPVWNDNFYGIKFAKELNAENPLGNGTITFCDKNTGEKLLEIRTDEGLISCLNDHIEICIKKETPLPFDKDIYVTLSEDVVRFEDGTCNAAVEDKNTWYFHTFPKEILPISNPAERIADQKYRDLFLPIRAAFVQLIENGMNGVCFGMCYSTIAWDERYSTLCSMIDKDSLFKMKDVRKPSSNGLSLLDYIQYAHIYQMTSVSQRTKDYSLDSIYEKIIDYLKNGGTPVIIGTKNRNGGHALLPVGIAKEDGNQCSFLLYNCTDPFQCYYLNITKTSGNWKQWDIRLVNPLRGKNDVIYSSEYPIWCTSVDATCDIAVNMANGTYKEGQSLFGTKMGSFKVNGKETYVAGNIGSSILTPIWTTSGEEDDADYYFYWSEEDRLEIDSENEVFQKIIFAKDSKSYVLDADVPAKVFVDLDDVKNAVKAELQEAGTITFEKGMLSDNNLQKISLKAYSDKNLISIMETGKGLSVSGVKTIEISGQENLENIPLVAKGLDDNVNYYITFDKEISVGEDSDGDGTVEKIMASTGLPISDTIITVGKQYYTGKEITPPLSVMCQDIQLNEGIDYTVSYLNNTKIGMASAVITGIGKYYGTKIITFEIIEKEHSWGKWVVSKTPTCMTDGISKRTCSICGKCEEKIVQALGHQWGNWAVKSKATVFGAEQQQRMCARCRTIETRVIGTKLKPTMKINATSIPLKVKQSTTKLKVSGLAAGDYIKSWKSSNTKIVKVNSKGKLTALNKTGKVTVTVMLASGLKKYIKVTVQKGTVKTKKISGVAKKLTLKRGTKKTLAPVITPITSLEKVKFKSSNTKIVSVSSKGVVTAKKAGTAKITVSSGSKKVTVSVKVTK